MRRATSFHCPRAGGFGTPKLIPTRGTFENTGRFVNTGRFENTGNFKNRKIHESEEGTAVLFTNSGFFKNAGSFENITTEEATGSELEGTGAFRNLGWFENAGAFLNGEGEEDERISDTSSDDEDKGENDNGKDKVTLNISSGARHTCRFKNIRLFRNTSRFENTGEFENIKLVDDTGNKADQTNGVDLREDAGDFENSGRFDNRGQFENTGHFLNRENGNADLHAKASAVVFPALNSPTEKVATTKPENEAAMVEYTGCGGECVGAGSSSVLEANEFGQGGLKRKWAGQ